MIAYWDFNDEDLTVDQGSGTLTTTFSSEDVPFYTGTTMRDAGCAMRDALTLGGLGALGGWPCLSHRGHRGHGERRADCPFLLRRSSFLVLR